MNNQHGMSTENKAQREQELTVMAVEFVGYQRFFAIYRHTCALKLRIYQDIVVSCVAEHGGRILKLVNEGATAYYVDPVEAVKSAVRMKTALQKHNTAVSDQDQIGFDG
jgi:class 3 adenylate cyclase